ncbi:hypothetical protein Cgig2_012127 [Carnegiea gigantea]|uniref:Ubiquitin thioesterase OTU n=1 Tax=Carnegiea gigantea TaxID=171969 RepID=A0A9Q1QMS8_9CARY|nr:hypothetical protein Cgig2_012127 [Carnegiea gigantea]
MVVCSSIKACGKSVLSLSGYFQEQMRGHVCNIVSLPPSSSYILKQGSFRNRYSYSLAPSISSCLSDGGFRGSQSIQYRSVAVTKWEYFPSLTVKCLVKPKELQEKLIDFWSGNQNGSLSTLVPTRKFKCNFGSWSNGSLTAGVVSGLLVCCASSDSVHAKASDKKGDNADGAEPSPAHLSYGKKVYTDYTVIGIPGDGSCLFRSVAHGACLRSGKPGPSESLQKQLADELRARVADELTKRREETEWFIEGNFDNYVSQIRKPHVWGGEPELLMLSHVLRWRLNRFMTHCRMPITVYMYDDKYGGLISIAEYGQEYGKDNPIRVLYHGFGHYDALLIPGRKGSRSR